MTLRWTVGIRVGYDFECKGAAWSTVPTGPAPTSDEMRAHCGKSSGWTHDPNFFFGPIDMSPNGSGGSTR